MADAADNRTNVLAKFARLFRHGNTNLMRFAVLVRSRAILSTVANSHPASHGPPELPALFFGQLRIYSPDGWSDRVRGAGGLSACCRGRHCSPLNCSIRRAGRPLSLGLCRRSRCQGKRNQSRENYHRAHVVLQWLMLLIIVPTYSQNSRDYFATEIQT